MTLTSTIVEQQFTNIVVNVPLNVNIQTSGIPAEIYVDYGSLRQLAVQGPDYSVVIAPDLMTFTITPLPALMTKIAADGTNVIYVRRELPLTTSFDYDDAFVREEIVSEFDRVWMVEQQNLHKLGALEDANDAADAAAISAANAHTSELNAATSEANAAASATNAANSATAALGSKNAAATSATNAGNSASAASGSATAAAGSATAANTSAGNAATSAGTATTQAGIATTQAGNASTSATNASNSASAASGSASGASSSAGAAATSATNAANSATAASGSATNSANSATAAAGSATAAANSAASVRDYRSATRRNGGLEIWQRGAGGAASFALAAGPATWYTADGWYLYNSANQASVVSQQAGLTNGSQWSAKVQRNAGQTGVIQQVFAFSLDTDEIYPLLGKFICLSFTAKAGANWSPASGTLSVQVVGGTGTPVKYMGGGYAGTFAAINTNINLTTTPTPYQAISAAILPINTRQLEVVFAWTPVGTAGADDSFTIDDVQIEIVPAATGYVASNFERLNFQEQLLLCQRHFYKTFPYNIAPAQAVGVDTGNIQGIAGKAGAVAGLQVYMRYPTILRVIPTIVLYNPNLSDAQLFNQSAGASCTGTANQGSTSGMRVSATGPGGTTVGDLLAIHATMDSGI